MSERPSVREAARTVLGLAEKATQGQWRTGGLSGRAIVVQYGPGDADHIANCVMGDVMGDVDGRANAAFIAAACDLAPLLAAEVERLTEALESAEEACRQVGQFWIADRIDAALPT